MSEASWRVHLEAVRPLAASVRGALHALPMASRAEAMAEEAAVAVAGAKPNEEVNKTALLSSACAQLAHMPTPSGERTQVLLAAGMGGPPPIAPHEDREDAGLLPCVALLAGTFGEDDCQLGWCLNFLLGPPPGLSTGWPEESESQANLSAPTPVLTSTAGQAAGSGERILRSQERPQGQEQRGHQHHTGKRSSDR